MHTQALVGVNVLEVGSLVKLLTTLVEAATEAVSSEAGQQYHADYLMYCVLGCLPWGGRDLHDRDPDALEALLGSAEAYLGTRFAVKQRKVKYHLNNIHTRRTRTT